MPNKKKKEAGRPAGTPNDKSGYVRDRSCNLRVTQGFDECIKELMCTARYKSKADVLHRALEILAARELPGNFYWSNKIQ